MPTVTCALNDCKNHGYEICIAKGIEVDHDGKVMCYDPNYKKSMEQFNSNCYKSGSKYKTSRVTGILK
jgi:hypothetical protein